MMRKSQPAEPRGVAGAVVGWLMLALNRGDNERALQLLDVHPDDHILEIGCGPGQLIELLAERAHQGYVAGIDLFEVMVQQAQRLNARHIATRLVEVSQGTVSQLPFEAERFDKIVSVHSFQFWPDPHHDLQEVKRVLRSGGVLVLVLRRLRRGKKADTEVNSIAKAYPNDLQALKDALYAAGFARVDIVGDKDVIAIRP